MTDGRRRVLLKGLLAGGLCASGPHAVHGRDVKVLPPEVRTFRSPAGTYLLEVRGRTNWKPPQAQAELFAIVGTERQKLWSRRLPHRYGPGTAFVTDAGRVLLIDEGIKTPSEYAVMLLDLGGDTVKRFSMSDIAVAAGVSEPDLITSARFGPWMSALPVPAPGREAMILEAGKVRLELSLDSGNVTRTGSADR